MENKRDYRRLFWVEWERYSSVFAYAADKEHKVRVTWWNCIWVKTFHVVRPIHHKYEGAKQLRELGLENLDDKKIWDYARENQFSIVSFDSEFYELSNYFGHPPKIICLRTGNIRSIEISHFVLDKFEVNQQFIYTCADVACIELD